MEFVLNMHEIRLVASVGVERRISGLSHDRKDRHGRPKYDYWATDIEASGAEFVASKALNKHWVMVADKPGELIGDVGRGTLQIRHTPLVDGSLIVHPEDPDDAPFLLVVGTIPKFRIVGGLLGADAKQECWWRGNIARPAFFVPQSELKSFKPPS